MSDEQLRWGERRWRANGSHDDEVRHLSARLRAGRVDPIRLALAAECGHAAARAALGRTPPAPDGRSLRDLATRVERAADDEARVRATMTLAHALLAAASDQVARAAAERALAATEEWLRCPCPGHLGLALRGWGALDRLETRDPRADGAAALLRVAVRAIERRGLARLALAHLRVTWLPWLVA